MKVIPGPGKSVRDPSSLALVPPDGRDVNELDMYWARRLRDGDVIPADQAPNPDAPATEA